MKIIGLQAIAFAALLPLASAWAAKQDDAPQLRLLDLYPKSTIDIEIHGRCLTISNDGEAVMFLPLALQSWKDIAANKRAPLKARPCVSAK